MAIGSPILSQWGTTMTQRDRLALCANSLLVVIDSIACVLSLLWQKKIGGKQVSDRIDDLLDIRVCVKEIKSELEVVDEA